MEIWEPKPPGTLWATPGLLRYSFNFFTLQAWLSRLVFGRCLVRISGGSLVALTGSSRDFPQYLQINSGLVLRLCHFRYLLLPFHFIVHESNYSTP